MRLLITTVALFALAIPSALAEGGAAGAGKGGKAGKGKDGVRAKILKRFDANGNGVLDPDEKAKLKKWRAENGKGKKRGPKGKAGPGAGKSEKPNGKKAGKPPKGGRGGTPPLRGGKTKGGG